jgi:RNA polymerase sigma factor (sigma-70 family)
MRDDRALLTAWGAGDAAAGAELFERHFAAVFRFFRNKAGDDLEDLVQTTFLRCLEAHATFRGEASLLTFLLTIARHELYAYWKKRQRRAEELDIGELSVEDLGPSPSRLVAEKRERALLARALRAIPLELQIVLELHYWEDLTGPELAAVLEVPEGTVRSRLKRGRELLEERMRALAAGDDGLLQSTLTGLDSWAASLKPLMAR